MIDRTSDDGSTASTGTRILRLERSELDEIGPANYVSAVGLDVVHQRPLESPLDPERKVLRQRHRARFNPSMCKALITRIPVFWVSGLRQTDVAARVDQDLYLFHLKLADFDRCMARLEMTRSFPW